MKKNSPIQQQLFNILEKEEFEKLTNYHDPECWNTWDVDDRFSLAVLFVKNGERLISSDKENGWKSFEHSLSIAPESNYIRQQIAASCLIQTDQIDLLERVIKVIEEGIQLDASSAELQVTCGMALFRKGVAAEEESDLRKSLEKFTAAEQIVSQASYSNDFLIRLFWGHAMTWHTLGKMGGEAVDFCQAVELYRKTAIFNPPGWQFWHEFGDACSELAFLLGNTDLAHEAVECYRRSIKENENIANSWEMNAMESYRPNLDSRS